MSDATTEVLDRIRAIASRAAQRPRERRARPTRTRGPSPSSDRAEDAKPEREAPPLHWQEEAEERALAARHVAVGRRRLEIEAGDVAARETACARLRAVLGDSAWHSALELVEAGGLRYGGRLHEIRRGLDGAPALEVEAEPRELPGRACGTTASRWCRHQRGRRGAPDARALGKRAKCDAGLERKGLRQPVADGACGSPSRVRDGTRRDHGVASRRRGIDLCSPAGGDRRAQRPRACRFRDPGLSG